MRKDEILMKSHILVFYSNMEQIEKFKEENIFLSENIEEKDNEIHQLSLQQAYFNDQLSGANERI